MENEFTTTGILKSPINRNILLYCLEPTKNLTFGCAYRGVFLQREPNSDWYRIHHKGELFLCKDDKGKLRRFSSRRFAKKLS